MQMRARHRQNDFYIDRLLLLWHEWGDFITVATIALVAATIVISAHEHT
jgi:hypothetical protein